MSVEGFQASEMLVFVVAVTRRSVGVVGGVVSPRLGVVVVVGFGLGAASATDPTEPPIASPDTMMRPTAIRRPAERCVTIPPRLPTTAAGSFERDTHEHPQGIAPGAGWRTGLVFAEALAEGGGGFTH